MDAKTRFFIYFAMLAFAFFAGLLRIRFLNKAARSLVLLMFFTMLSELIAHYTGLILKNNMPVYHVFAPLQMFLTALYYNYSIDTFCKNNMGIYIGLTGVVLSILNTLFLQPIYTFNNYFILFAGCCVIAMSLYSFYRILEHEDTSVFKSPHFWVTAILLFFWSTTYINWSLYNIIKLKKLTLIPFIGISLWFINLTTYWGFGLVFIFYPKKIVKK